MSDERWELTEDEARTGRIVWVCENGCIDVAHKTEGNYLDLCSRCGEGVCEPRKTLGRRSKEQRQRDRDLGVETPRRRRKRSTSRPANVTVTRGGATTEVEPEAFRNDPTPPFALAKADRAAILAGKTPRISFPRQAPDDHPADAPYPAAVGDVVDVSSNVQIEVRGLRILVDSIVLQYEVHDRRAPVGGTPIHTVKAVDRPQERMGGPQFRPEREPQPLAAREVRKLADRVREAELAKLERTRADLGRHLKEQADAPRDVRFHLRKTLEAIERRIENILADMEAAA